MAKLVKVFDVPDGSLRASGSDFVTFPSGGVTAVTTAATQTLTNKTLTSPTVTGGTATNTTLVTPTHTMGFQELAGAGTTITDAAAITAASGSFIHATGGNNSVGIILPTAAAGKYYYVKNADAANGIMKVYPQVNSQINAVAANGALSMAAKTAAVFVAMNATNWATFSLLPS